MTTIHKRQRLLQARSRKAQQVTLVGALVNTCLAAIKITMGWLGHSQALLADGVHSLSDLFSDAVVWLAARRAGRLPDASYPYGQGRFETVATLGLGIMLLVVAVGIIWGATKRLMDASFMMPETFVLYGAALSIMINEALYWYTRIQAQHIRSDMLLANAWHHRSDAISSVVVFIGVGGSLLGWPHLDALAAVVVAVMIAKIGWRLGASAVAELADRGLDEPTITRIKTLTQNIPGIISLHGLRTRKIGHEALADIHVLVNPWLSVSEGHMLSILVEETIKKHIAEINDVTVHVDPENDERVPPCLGLPLRQKALGQLQQAWSNIADIDQHKRVILHYLSGQIHVEVFLPLGAFKSAAKADELRQQLQKPLKSLDHFGRVVIHFSAYDVTEVRLHSVEE